MMAKVVGAPASVLAPTAMGFAPSFGSAYTSGLPTGVAIHPSRSSVPSLKSSGVGAAVVVVGAVVDVEAGTEGGVEPSEARSPEHDARSEAAATTATMRPTAGAGRRGERVRRGSVVTGTADDRTRRMVERIRHLTDQSIQFPPMEINGISAIVTGGASGLGEATARHLASLGAKVVVADLDRQQEKGDALAKEIGGVFVPCDVTKTDEIIAAVEAAKEQGPLKALVNCAGIGWATRTIGKDGQFSFWQWLKTEHGFWARISDPVLSGSPPPPKKKDPLIPSGYKSHLSWHSPSSRPSSYLPSAAAPG